MRGERREGEGGAANLGDAYGAAESGQLEQLFQGERVFADEFLKQLARLPLTATTHAFDTRTQQLTIEAQT